MSTPTQEPTTPTTEAPPTVDWQAKAAELEKKAYEAEARAAAAEAAKQAWETATARQQPQQQQPQAPRLPDDWDVMSEAEQLRWEIEQERAQRRQQEQQRDAKDAEDKGRIHWQNLRRDCLAEVPEEMRPYVLAEMDEIAKGVSVLANGYGQDWIDNVVALAEGKYSRKARVAAAKAAKEPAAGAGNAEDGFDAYLVRRWRGLSPDRADKKPSDRQMENMRNDTGLRRDWKDSQ